MRNMLALVLLVIMLMAIIGCGGSSYVGTWGQQGTGNTVVFNSDGTGYINSPDSTAIAFHWTSESGEARLGVDSSPGAKTKCRIKNGHLLIFTSLDATSPSQVVDRIK